MQFSTLRSSTRGIPRSLFGNSDWIVFHSNSVSSLQPTASISLKSLNPFLADLPMVYEYAA